MKLSRCEELYIRIPKPPALTAVCLRYWLNFRLTGDRHMLNRANHRIITCTDWSLELQFAGIFFAVELEMYDNAVELLERVAGYRNYFKANRPVYYGVYLFIQALIDIRIGKDRAAAKHFKLLSELAEARPEGELPLMLGWLKLEGTEGVGSVWDYLTVCYKKGCRSVFLFERVYRFLLTGADLTASGGDLLIVFINWAVNQGLNIGGIIDAYMEEIIAAAKEPQLERFYGEYPDKRLLTTICNSYIDRSDYSEAAYKYYHEAETRQLDIPRLQQALMYSAYHGRFQERTAELGRYTMERFLQNGFEDADESLRAYVYHVLLTSKKMRDFVPELSGEILQFAAYCLKNGLMGRYYNSIYKYFLEHEDPVASGAPEADIPGGQLSVSALADTSSEILQKNIFTYKVRVSNPLVRHIWIVEKEKRGAAVYEVNDKEAVVRASSEHFSYICFSEGVKHILDEKIKITKMVENADIGLYARFYARGCRTAEILIALARHCLGQETLNQDSAGVLEAAAALKGISTAFKMQLCARLGDYFYDAQNIDLAREYYHNVDENYLNDKYIERMLTVFINTGEYRKAAWLIAKKAHCIPDKALFQAMKRIAAAEPESAEHIAPAAYALLLRSWYDKTLIDIVIKHYKASQAEWEELNKALNQLSAPEPGLDELILYNAAWIRKPNAEAQKVFSRMYRESPENALVGVFAYYLTYEMLMNDMKPEYDVISVLESIFHEYKDNLLAYALANIYMVHGLTTLQSDEIIAWALGAMEREGFVLPGFKRSQDKKARTPYIEKYQAFTYKALPDKNLRLYYRANGETDYRSQRMKYLRFGLYYTIVPHFYGEKLEYYFSEEMPTGSITTKEAVADNNHVYLDEGEADQYFVINNALIYEQMFKYEKVEAIITESLRELRAVRARLM